MIYGFDIGGSKIELVVFDGDLEPVERHRVATPTTDYAAFLTAVTDLVALADTNHGPGWPIGVGIPGLVDGRGHAFCANVPAAMGKPVAADLRARLDRPVVTENDCRLFALSEANGGAGSGVMRCFGAILGTGAAGGLVVDGRVVQGRQGIAGEYGHMQISAAIVQRHDLPIWPCGCGLPACVESYIAGPGILAIGRYFGLEADSTADMVSAWRTDDPRAARARAAFEDVLGSTFATVVMMYDPDIIVLGGGMSKVDDIVAVIPSAIDRHLFHGFHAPPVVRATFGDSSGVRGAALLAREGCRV